VSQICPELFRKSEGQILAALKKSFMLNWVMYQINRKKGIKNQKRAVHTQALFIRILKIQKLLVLSC
jgi:hypothetical protein